MADGDYILVKDEKGALKYFKDGQYFDIEEIDRPAPTAEQVKSARTLRDIDLTPEPEDEEIVAHQHLDSHRQIVDGNIKNAVAAVIDDLKVNFTDEEIRRKFMKLIESRLREVRTDKEVEYFLTVPKADGGFGLDAERAQLVIAVIKKHEPTVVEVKKQVAEKIEVKKTVSAPPPVLKPITPPAAPRPTMPAPPKKDIVAELLAKEKPEFTINDLIKDKKPSAPVMKPVVTDKKPMADVTYRPRLLGPIEELRTMDMVNFHRLGNTIEAIIATLEEKIANQRHESWKKGMDAVLAWKDSEVFNIYMQMGVQSALTNKKIADVIVDRQIKNQPSLTQAEFEAILNFNKTLDI